VEASAPEVFMNWKLAIAAALLFSGCSHATRSLGPDGESMVEVRCGRKTATCYARAREACGGNFHVADDREHTVYVSQANAQYASTTPVRVEKLLVVCDQQPSCRATSDCPDGQTCRLGVGDGAAGVCG